MIEKNPEATTRYHLKPWTEVENLEHMCEENQQKSMNCVWSSGLRVFDIQFYITQNTYFYKQTKTA